MKITNINEKKKMTVRDVEANHLFQVVDNGAIGYRMCNGYTFLNLDNGKPAMCPIFFDFNKPSKDEDFTFEVLDLGEVVEFVEVKVRS